MDCLYPVTQAHPTYGTTIVRRCGYCESCRYTKRQEWSARIQLEAMCHDYSTFATMTYSSEFLPYPPQVLPKDLQLFIKRLRRRLEPRIIRFFACGEYGSRSLRPHYHAVFFGLECSLEVEKIVLDSWGMGHISVSEITSSRASYVAKYIAKDVSGDDPVPKEWNREFARMSNRPGIGALYADAMADAVNHANDKLVARGLLPVTDLLGGSIRIGPVFYPNSRYIRDRMMSNIKFGVASDLANAIKSADRARIAILEKVINPKSDVDVAKHSRDKIRKKLRRSAGDL